MSGLEVRESGRADFPSIPQARLLARRFRCVAKLASAESLVFSLSPQFQQSDVLWPRGAGDQSTSRGPVAGARTQW